jgi:diguanylate cyclase (GGDEF)-like protein
VSGAAERKRAISWAFDAAVIASGATLSLIGLLVLLLSGELDVHWALALAIGAPVVAVMSRFPLVLSRSSTGIEVGFDSAVLVFLACFHGGAGALAVWAVGQVLSQILTSKRGDVRAFNVGLGVSAGWAALLVMRAISPLDGHDLRELTAVTVGVAVYFVVDYVVSAASIALEEGRPVGTALWQARAFAALGTFVAIDSLGYLAALVVRALPGWPGLLLAVPLVTILVATRAISRGNEHRRRLSALFDAAAEAHVVQSRDALESLVRRSARAAVAHGRADLRTDPPGAKEVGAPVRAGTRALWIVSPALDRARASVTADRMALEALATVAEEAYARLALTAEMGRLANHDALTSLPNRTLFLDRVEQAVSRSRRGGDPFAVLFLDLDGFKGVNDRFGHGEGDELLKTVAARLTGCLRAEDSVARLGGDEFAVLVEGVEAVDDIGGLCRRMLDALRREVTIAGHDVVVGASIGVALADPGDDATSLLRNADMAMYRAKALGKDQYFVYRSALRQENVRRLELVEALRRGMATELVIHYQPVVDLDRGRVDGVEALVRWQRPEGLVPPDQFIPAAEESGLIVELGERVLAQVVADAPLLQAAAGRPLSMACNMSALQPRDPDFTRLVGCAVAALGGSRLVLEMTETVVVGDDDETERALRTLKSLGALLAIDDFGVGFSSIGYLQQLPVDILKIDRSFVADVDVDPRAAAIVEAILVMATALDLRVVAEGVERAAQVHRLRAAGCRIAQGFHFGRPAPLAQVVQSLQDGVAGVREPSDTPPLGGFANLGYRGIPTVT